MRAKPVYKIIKPTLSGLMSICGHFDTSTSGFFLGSSGNTDIIDKIQMIQMPTENKT
jgi:hypothetical protein